VVFGDGLTTSRFSHIKSRHILLLELVPFTRVAAAFRLADASMVSVCRRTILCFLAASVGLYDLTTSCFQGDTHSGIIGPTIGRLLLWKEGPSLDLYFRTDLRFDSLMWGALAAWISFNRSTIPLQKILGGCALIAFVVMSRFNLLSNGFLYLGGYCLIGVMGLYLMIAGTNSSPRWLSSALEFRPLRWTGKISVVADDNQKIAC